MDAETILCAAWRSDVLPDTYLFVDQETGLEKVPEELLSRFGQAHLVTTFKLHAGRHMAKANSAEVLRAIQERGFYLQLPSVEDAVMSVVAARNEKLAR